MYRMRKVAVTSTHIAPVYPGYQKTADRGTRPDPPSGASLSSYLPCFSAVMFSVTGRSRTKVFHVTKIKLLAYLVTAMESLLVANLQIHTLLRFHILVLL